MALVPAISETCSPTLIPLLSLNILKEFDLANLPYFAQILPYNDTFPDNFYRRNLHHWISIPSAYLIDPTRAPGDSSAAYRARIHV